MKYINHCYMYSCIIHVYMYIAQQVKTHEECTNYSAQVIPGMHGMQGVQCCKIPDMY